jgi:hypothetical protein
MKSIQELENLTYVKLAVILIVIGILLAIDSLFNLNFIYKLWPVLTVMLGIGFIGIFTTRKKKGILYLVIGEYLICFSGLAFFCNFAGWSVLSTLWPIFITFLGIVFFTIYLHRKEKRSLFFLSIILLLVSLYFSIIFSYDNNSWWMIFIIVGISILIGRKR